jgi:glyoxylase-like metal-dependent hydrolase (beta-lactamase superfamily II)
MEPQIPLSDLARAENSDADEVRDDKTHEVISDLAYKRLAIVNVVFYGVPGAGDGNWILVDAGIPATSGFILAAAKERFGGQGRPGAIVQTHGHFDHVGSLETLAEHWQVPIFAHDLELPYLDGSASYPPPDPSVGGGLMSRLSPLFPRGPINVSRWLKALPADGSVPGMPEWRWIHTPGHAPGHVSLWRESDRALIAGDAFITTRQESVYAAATQEFEMHGPPMYYTQNWVEAKSSVERLAALRPELAITGHGVPARGNAFLVALTELANQFDQVAVPKEGRYVDKPASVADGSAYSS